ncbi:cobalamin biosynthesis protein [Actinoplanes bogorensis]|uniref:Cobalamin biosynthesis protein n=1 Tax=Paractinoplanes bogorensis TaxID=1610840 RepID=A0ABS5YLQ3_9ACTN|nr:cobalamin biosynthesis protein [Actinoplanes bogorensis]MBU2664392.1 cobalamin biosynthesis protein [Actinoplanes bogorensis]
MTAAVGIGARRSASADDVRAAVEATLRAAGLTDADVSAVGTIDRRGDAPGVRETALDRGWSLRLFTAAELAAREVPTPSAAVAQAVGTPSVAEAAALCAAGPDAELIVAKRIFPGVTVAIAATPILDRSAAPPAP